MNREFLSVLKTIVTAAWRRRYVLSLPFLIMLPLSCVFALYGPRTYVSKSLMLLQETGPSNPLARDGSAPLSRIQDRVAGLQTLLKSDRVLGNVYRDLVGDPTGNPREMAGWIRDFSLQLSLDLIGTDFLEFQLKGGDPRGMGKRLEAVTSRFLEALLPEQNALFASQVLLDKRKEEMEVAQRALSVFKQRLSERLPQGLSGLQARLGETRAALQSKETQLQQLLAEIARVRGSGNGSGRIDQEIAQVRAELAGLERQGDGAAGDLNRVRARLVGLTQAQTLEAGKAGLESDIRELTRQVEVTQKAVRQAQPAAEQLTQLEREAAEARESYDEYTRRYQRAATTRAGGILNAPERIKLIDAPRDPDFPATSAVRIAVMALVTSLVLGLGLAVASEILDPRLRSPEDLADATGLPVVGKLA